MIELTFDLESRFTHAPGRPGRFIAQAETLTIGYRSFQRLQRSTMSPSPNDNDKKRRRRSDYPFFLSYRTRWFAPSLCPSSSPLFV